jgi:ribosome-binding ATPase
VFDDPSVPHAAGSIDPLRDATNLELELILSDHDQITRRLERVEKDLKKKADPLLQLEKTVLDKCKAHLEAEKPLRELELTAEERRPIGGFLFLSARPVLYVLNVGDDEADKLDSAVERHKLTSLAGKPNAAVVAVCGRLEAELAEMEEAEAAELLASYGLKEPGLNRLIRATYELMGLTSFFTAGEPEVRAWTIRKGSTAVKAAGAIHSDIEKGFIRAEVVRWNDLLAAGKGAGEVGGEGIHCPRGRCDFVPAQRVIREFEHAVRQCANHEGCDARTEVDDCARDYGYIGAHVGEEAGAYPHRDSECGVGRLGIQGSSKRRVGREQEVGN